VFEKLKEKSKYQIDLPPDETMDVMDVVEAPYVEILS
jgi:hypothetical protein